MATKERYHLPKYQIDWEIFFLWHKGIKVRRLIRSIFIATCNFFEYSINNKRKVSKTISRETFGKSAGTVWLETQNRGACTRTWHGINNLIKRNNKFLLVIDGFLAKESFLATRKRNKERPFSTSLSFLFKWYFTLSRSATQEISSEKLIYPLISVSSGGVLRILSARRSR